MYIYLSERNGIMEGICLGAVWDVFCRSFALRGSFSSFAEMARLADAVLINSICSNPSHVLRYYYMDKKPSGDILRPGLIALPY